MYISDEAETKAIQRIDFISVGILTLILTFIFRINIIASFLLGVGVYILPSIFIRPMFKNMVAKKIQRKMNNQALQEYEYQEEREHQKILNRKRNELEIEFEHYKRIAMLHAQTDESKMRLIAQMEREFNRTKDNDLQALNAQIERMKREL